MGILDNSNANILIDAVLTDLGRQLLAANDNSFSIRRFSLADDEVDYGTITRFGITVGKEKIEKNTPVFEAQTNSSLAIKYNCVSISANALTTYPTLTITSASGRTISGDAVSFDTKNPSNIFTNAVITQTPPSGYSTIVSELLEDVFYVKVNRRFLTVGGTPISSEPNGTDVYEIIANPAGGGSTANFRLSTVLSSVSTDFTTYGNGSSIITPVRVVGGRTGMTVDIIVTIIN